VHEVAASAFSDTARSFSIRSLPLRREKGLYRLLVASRRVLGVPEIVFPTCKNTLKV